MLLLIVLTAWLLASFPVAVVVGRCMKFGRAL